MHDICETVKIKGQDGKELIVNKSDYDADQAEGGAHAMELYGDGVAPETNKIAPIDNTNTGARMPDGTLVKMLVDKRGKGKDARFFVIGEDGQIINDAKLDPNGYADEATAWGAATAVTMAAQSQTPVKPGEISPPAFAERMADTLPADAALTPPPVDGEGNPVPPVA